MTIRSGILCFGLAALACGLWANISSAQNAGLTKYPESIDPSCNYGRAKLYDECGSQLELFEEALAAANRQRKTLLVSYGAEWCIWCHVFDKHLSGSHTIMRYRYAEPGDRTYEDVTLFEFSNVDTPDEAMRLHSYSAKTFVIVHIESWFSADGDAVLDVTAALPNYSGEIPFVFSVNRDGKFAASLHSSTVETRRDNAISWYRGYDRPNLISELERLHQMAQR
ncbi:MAG: thioredoxin family protein [Pseudomonadota bacterium]